MDQNPTTTGTRSPRHTRSRANTNMNWCKIGWHTIYLMVHRISHKAYWKCAKCGKIEKNLSKGMWGTYKGSMEVNE